jgi:paraquat-inducible protein A
VSEHKRSYDPYMSATELIACHDCDLLQRETPVASGGVATCTRCGAVLYRNVTAGLEKTLAYAITAAVLFLLANAFPIATLDAQGVRTATTVFGTARALHETGMTSVAVLVFMTAIALPALELIAIIYLLLPLRLGHVPPLFALMFRLLHVVRPWCMVEVFLLGALVSVSKLKQIALVTPGIGLWSLAALMMVIAAADAACDERALWERAEAMR